MSHTSSLQKISFGTSTKHTYIREEEAGGREVKAFKKECEEEEGL